MVGLDRASSGVPRRPDATSPPSRSGRTWACAALIVALAVQGVLGFAAVFVAGFGGDAIAGPLLGTWAVATGLVALLLIMVARDRWRPSMAWIALGAVAVTVIAFPVATGPLRDLQACTGARRDAVMTVSPYGGRSVEIRGGQYGCGYTLDLREPVVPVVGYYRDGFEQAGWTVATSAEGGEGQIEGGGTFTAGELDASKDGQTVSIVFEGANDGTYASVSITAT